MKIKFLIFSLAMIFSITSCIEDKPLENDQIGNPEEFTAMQNNFVAATDGLTPMNIKVGEYAFFRNYAKLYTGSYQQQGFVKAEVVELGDDEEVIEGETYPIKKINTVVSYYLPIQSEGETPVLDPSVPEKEWKCKFVKPPYYVWLDNCELPPEQNLWVFHMLGIPEKPIFFSVAKYKAKQKLPKKMIDEGRCYNFTDCEYNINILEYDLIFEAADGTRERRHYLTGFSGELPYLASNPLTCFSTLITIDNQKHPVELCQELVDFRPEL